MVHIQIGPLVRAVDNTNALIWAELSQDCYVNLQASSNTGESRSCQARTVNVGSHYVVLLYLHDLQPGTWYDYSLNDTHGARLSMANNTEIKQSFRTFTDRTDTQKLRVAYGSCRKAGAGEEDTLAAFGLWLMEQQAHRDESWPQAMLLIGDQIYADQPPQALIQQYPRLAHGATSFTDFSLCYEYAWGKSVGVRQALANLPTYMMFDDHEVTNNWNCAPDWRARMLSTAETRQTIVDGMSAYWVYQGWGNTLPGQDEDNPLTQIMRVGQETGNDVLETLRATITAAVYEKRPLTWHYHIASIPPLFVLDTRSERTAYLEPGSEHDGPTRITSTQQIGALQHWLHANSQYPALMVSSVPALLPPVIGSLEYLAGLRGLALKTGWWGWIGKKLARWQVRFANKTGFDHWPVYHDSWHELLTALAGRRQASIILSGDVHFSYAMHGKNKRKGTDIYQFVSTPLQNRLSPGDAGKIRLQAKLGTLRYGGLTTRVLPLHTNAGVNAEGHLLFENAIAMLEVAHNSDGTYHIQNQYLGIQGEILTSIAQTKLKD